KDGMSVRGQPASDVLSTPSDDAAMALLLVSTPVLRSHDEIPPPSATVIWISGWLSPTSRARPFMRTYRLPPAPPAKASRRTARGMVLPAFRRLGRDHRFSSTLLGRRCVCVCS